MQQHEKIAKLMEWFSCAAARHAEALEDLREETAAVQVQSLNRCYTALMKEGGLERFLTLLDDENAAVAGMAAVYAMREAPDRCGAVLAKIAQTPGLLGFRAQIALDRWASGEWPNR